MRWFPFVVALLILSGCGGGGGGDAASGGGGGGGGALTDAVRMAAIKKVETQIETLETQNLTPAQENTQIAAYMATLPEFSASGVSVDLSAWGRFRDGRFLIVSNNRDPQWQQPIPAGSPLPARQTRGANDLIATTKHARLFHSFGTGFDQQQTVIARMKTWLQDAGYTIAATNEGDGRLASLRNVSGDGFFYFNTHGGSAQISETEKVFNIQSSTLANEDNEKLPEIKADLDAGRIHYMTAKNGSTRTFLGKEYADWDTRYSINYKFIQAHMSFGKNAVVFINACYSGYTKSDNGAQTMMVAVASKGGAAYLGWDGVVATPTSERAPEYFVDRMTAGNEVDKETPDQRAFFATQVVADMKKHGLVPGANGTDLVLRLTAAGADVGLRPTIEYVWMSEQTDTLHVYGQFGNERGTAKVDGTDVTVLDWTSDEIELRIPKSGSGSAGDVVVTANGKESNSRRLFKFTTTFRFDNRGPQTLHALIDAKLVFRQDFAKRRDAMGKIPELKDPIPFFCSPESTLTFSASGTETDSKGKVITRWTGGGACTWSVIPPTGPNNTFCANGAYDPVTNEFGLGVVSGGAQTITDDSGTHTVMVGGGAMLRNPNIQTWAIPAFSQPGDTSFSFTAMTPSPGVNPDQEF